MQTKTCEYCGFSHNINLHPKCPKCRDEFAWAALSALDGMMSPSDTADAAYEYADAMMERRSRG